jgi:hypothetical protein
VGIVKQNNLGLLKRRWFEILFVIAALFTLFVATIIRVESTFVVHDSFYLPTTYKGDRVVRYGVSRIHQLAFGDGRKADGNNYIGRCFIDVEHAGRVVRTHGSILRVEVLHDLSRVYLELVP